MDTNHDFNYSLSFQKKKKMYPHVSNIMMSNGNETQRRESFSITKPPVTATFTGIRLLNVDDTDPPRSPVPWSTGLCDCCDDVTTCCLTCWCPCVTFGRIAEMVDRGSTSCGVSGALYTLILCVSGCSCMYSCFYRAKLRGQYFLEESPCTDCCVHCCCQICALCQEYRQLKNYGFDMSIGWHGNEERKKRVAAMPPTVEGSMRR